MWYEVTIDGVPPCFKHIECRGHYKCQGLLFVYWNRFLDWLIRV